ncbi:ImmA/IrrE family metallo-endopeptidase [Myxococcus sp. RHSTA-1-4]|uniref:helix-turn-helix domain-containing protein n=1 Tax=Myxococcus sp. RHSTA-1-4 TaxID=2874601 RepID=UPI001CC09AE2|nr:XRE family transcriptional regulator [Myxococcus sp. RHSTA-1-4]MBZ4422988.1 XRE family transcriptional regulator [Myxococcus sp. RHSTA-1-4]
MVTTWQQLGARLAEARKAAGLSQAELAAALNLDRTVITKLEAGERKLDAIELTRIAERLNRPLDWFLVPSPPAVVSRRKSRDLADDSRADVLLEGLARDVNLLVELKVLEPPLPPRTRSIDSVTSAEAAARELRKNLGLPLGPIWEVQALAEKVGLYAFALDLQDDALDGSYLRLDQGGVALVNGRAQTGRRRFTLVHELGHHIFADDFSSEWIVGADGDDRERLINAFAIHFLMPRESIRSRWQELEGRANARAAAIVLGAEYGVSWTAVLGHLCNLDLIDSGMRDRLDAERPRKADYLDGGVTLREELAPPSIPPRFAQAVVRAYKRHKVSAERALELLHGALSAGDLPPQDRIPLESMRSQFDLD